MKKKILLTLSLLLFMFFEILDINTVSALWDKGYPPVNEQQGVTLTPNNGQKPSFRKQTLKVAVTGISLPKPSTYWTQGDEDQWSAVRNEGADREVTSTYVDRSGDKWPVAKYVTDKINTRNYAPESMTDIVGNPFRQEFVEELDLLNVSYVPGRTYGYDEDPQWQKGDLFAVLKTKTGKLPEDDRLYEEAERKKYSEKPNGEAKYQVKYEVPLRIEYTGFVKEVKELKVEEDMTMAVDEKKPLYAKAKTTQYDGSESSWVDISYRSSVEWETDNESVATVDNAGRVTAVGPGTAKITAIWDSGKDSVGSPYHLYDHAIVTVDGEPPEELEPDGRAACTYTINPPYQGSTPTTTFMDPGAQGHILGDDATNGIHFDATRGIPTSENLYANTWAYNYLYQHTFGQQRGTITYDCTAEVTYVLEWQELQEPGRDADGNPVEVPPEPKTDSVPHTYNFSFERNYSYWTVNNLEVYGINQALMENYALPGGTVTLTPSGYSSPTVSLEKKENVVEHVMPKDTGSISFVPDVVDGGIRSGPPPLPNHEPTLLGLAEGQTGPPDVKNDSLDFSWNGTTTKVMDGSTVSQDGPTPTKIPNAPKIGSYKDRGETVLYKDKLLISSSSLENKANTDSSGEIDYALVQPTVGGSSNKKYPINPINLVTVHTPVVNYSSVSDDQPHNQRTTPDMSRAALILNRPFTIRIPTSGQHLDSGAYPGYGDRDYAKYFRTKQVRFPFDVYREDRTTLISANNWIDIPVGDLDTNFFLPVWVDEGDYQVYFRSIAENAPSGFSWQADANTNLIHHVATDQVSVQVIGRLYDFHITDILDYNWERVFRTGSGSSQPTGLSYWVGENGIDGDPRGNHQQFTLPIRPGSNPLTGMKNVSVKTGYGFSFDFKTMGNMFDPKDGIRITPTFSFVNKEGGTPIPVDLYYKTNEKPFVKIGSEEDTVERYVILNDRMRNVPLVPLTDAANFKYAQHLSAEEKASTTKQEFVENYVLDYTKSKTPVGGYDLLMFPEQLKTLIGPKDIPSNATVTTERANASIQQWYGEYSLPADPYVVPAGTNLAEYGRLNGGLDDDSGIFLKDGYIVVNFDIESIQEGNVNEPYLQYIHAPLMNQWQLEGYDKLITDSYSSQFNVKDGDVVFYNADKSSKNDFSSHVPH